MVWRMDVLTRRLCCYRLHPSLLLRVGQVCSPQLSTASASIGLASFKKRCYPDVLSSLNFQFQRRMFHHHVANPPAHHLPQSGLSLTGSRLRPPWVTIQARTIVNHRWVNYSKNRGKKKSVKAVTKRFHRTGSGKLKYWPAGKVHNMLCKSYNHRQSLRKPRYATKIQLKTLNKMIAGW